MDTLTFKPEDHSYWLAGRKLPGVTETINRIAPHRPVDEWFLQRGSAVHAAIPLALADELDWESVDERITGRVNSVLKFLKDTRLTPITLEKSLVSTRYQFAGTLDFFGEDEEGNRILADWKGSLCHQVEPQIGAYSLLCQETGGLPDRAVAVETHDNGTYRCRWFDKRSIRLAQQTFLAFLTTRNWLETHKFKTPTL